jgi:hypothetical protein
VLDLDFTTHGKGLEFAMLEKMTPEVMHTSLGWTWCKVPGKNLRKIEEKEKKICQPLCKVCRTRMMNKYLKILTCKMKTTNTTIETYLLMMRPEHCKVQKNSSNYRQRTPTLQSRSKQKKTTSNKLASKHEQTQLQPQDPKLTNLNQTRTSNNRRTNEPMNKKQSLN